jgi:putative nucleotidyltransferase with HDIG domain
METAIAMELPRAQVDNIRAAGLLHDIGKIEISADVLGKAAALTSEEKALMDSHAVKGGFLLSSVGSVLKEVVPIVIAHHKYFMDTIEEAKRCTRRYRSGLALRVADAFDAMVTDRPYRKGCSLECIEELIAKSGNNSTLKS